VENSGYAIHFFQSFEFCYICSHSTMTWTTKPVLSWIYLWQYPTKKCMGQNYWFFFYAKNH